MTRIIESVFLVLALAAIVVLGLHAPLAITSVIAIGVWTIVVIAVLMLLWSDG